MRNVVIQSMRAAYPIKLAYGFLLHYSHLVFSIFTGFVRSHKVQLKIIALGDGLLPKKQQAIILPNFYPVHWRMDVSPHSIMSND